MTAAVGAFEQSLAEAIAQYNAGHVERAESLCRSLLAQHPDNAALLQLLAVLLLKRGHLPEARSRIERSLAVRTNHLASLLIAGQIERASADLRAAARYFARAATLAPRASEPSYLLGATLTELGDATAVTVLRGLVTANPNDAGGWCQLGVALKSTSALEESLVALERAIALDANLARAQATRGAVLHALGRLEPAILALHRAHELQPGSAPIAHDLGMALHQASQLGAAREVLERAVALDPKFAQAWFRLGLVRQDQQQLDLAAAAFCAALECRPDYAEAAVNLGIVRQDQRDLDGALQSYRHAVRLRADTLGRIAQALTAGSTGSLWLAPSELRRQLRLDSHAAATTISQGRGE